MSSVTHDAKRASANRQYNVIPISEAHSIDRQSWGTITPLPTKADGNLVRTTVTVEYKRFPRTDMHDKTRTRTFDTAITNASHKRNARHKRSKVYYTPSKP